MTKKILALILVFIMIFSFASCGKKNINTNTENNNIIENNNTINDENNTQNNEVNNTPENNEITGAWDIVNIPFEQASEEVKKIYNDAAEKLEEKLIPITYVGSQIVSGTNYAFISKDENNNNRQVYIYKTLEDIIEEVKISEIGKTLEELPEIKVEEQKEDDKSTENTTENAVENTTANQNTNQNNSSQNNTSAQNNQTSQNNTPANSAREALLNKYGSEEAMKKALDASGDMNVSVVGNVITYNYQYEEEFSESAREVMREELENVIIGKNQASYTKFVNDLEKQTGISGITVVMSYIDKSGNEIATIRFNNKGLIH